MIPLLYNLLGYTVLNDQILSQYLLKCRFYSQNVNKTNTSDLRLDVIFRFYLVYEAIIF